MTKAAFTVECHSHTADLFFSATELSLHIFILTSYCRRNCLTKKVERRDPAMMTEQRPANCPSPPSASVNLLPNRPPCLTSLRSDQPSTDPEEVAHKTPVKPFLGAQTPGAQTWGLSSEPAGRNKPEFSTSPRSHVLSHQVKELICCSHRTVTRADTLQLRGC